MPKVTIVVPAFNSEKTIAETLCALRHQSFQDFEVIIVNDGSTDGTRNVVTTFLTDPRFRITDQHNRGLAGARNTGIAQARGKYIGFCDADDIWLPPKLAQHVTHLDTTPHVGVSYSGARFMDDNSQVLSLGQSPKLRGVDAAHVFKRNPVGNGSSPLVRRSVFDEISFTPRSEMARPWYFDETFRQSEDIECWLRICLLTDWQLEGVAGRPLLYRINSSGLSANMDRQLVSWERMVAKLSLFEPEFIAKNVAAARAYQYRYLIRRAISMGDPSQAQKYTNALLKTSWCPAWEEPLKTLVTLSAALFLKSTNINPMRAANILRR